jgi:hypothetical protein
MPRSCEGSEAGPTIHPRRTKLISVVLQSTIIAAAGLMCSTQAFAQGQLVYSQLGPVNPPNPFVNSTSPRSAPSLDADGRVAYLRSTNSRSIYTALGDTIAPSILENRDTTSPDYRPIDSSGRSPLITLGTVYAAEISTTLGPRVYRNDNGVVQTILSPNQLLDAAAGTVVAGQSGPLGILAGHGNSLVVPLRTRTPNDPESLYRTSLIRIDGTQTTLISTMGLTAATGTTQQFATNSNPRSANSLIDPTGRVYFSASLAQGTSGQQYTAGIWTHSLTGGMVPLYLARTNTNDPIPSGAFSVNAQGDIAFRSTNNISYIRSNTTGELTPIQILPGQPDTLNSVTRNLAVLNNNGQVLSSLSFSSSPSGRAQAVVITDPTLGPRVIARSGDPLPGFAGMFMSLSLNLPASGSDLPLFSPLLNTNSTASFDQIALNNLGQAVFLGGGGSFGATTDLNALFAYDPRGGLVTLALVGQRLPASLPGLASTATVTEINFVGNANTTSGFATGLNDQGLVAFRASFSDGSSRLITVQLPSAGALTTLALASVFAARRRRVR